MSKKTIFRGTIPNDQTGDTAYVFTGKINDNFDELYAQIPTPTILLNQSGSFTQGIATKTWLEKLVITPQVGTPTVKIGTTEGGNEILDTILVGDYLPVAIQKYFAAGVTLYFTAASGNINIRFDQTLQFFP